MQKNKRGIELSFNVMFSIILIIATIAIAFYVISAFLGTKKCAEVNLFYENLEEHITDAWNSRIHQGKCCSAILPSNIELVCFGNSTQTPAREYKEQYEELVPKIIKQMNSMPYIDSKGRSYKYGEFFPSELSPFCYNETIAQEYFPLTKEEVLKQGYRWKEPEARNYQIDIKTKDIPNDIKGVKKEIIGKVIECKNNSDARRGRSPDHKRRER